MTRSVNPINGGHMMASTQRTTL